MNEIKFEVKFCCSLDEIMFAERHHSAGSFMSASQAMLWRDTVNEPREGPALLVYVSHMDSPALPVFIHELWMLRFLVTSKSSLHFIIESPQVGFEPTTTRLTVERSTTELLRNSSRQDTDQ